jgi:Fe2+ transport system protein FeoA
VAAIVRLTDLDVGQAARLEELRLDADAAGLLRALGLTTACELRLCQAGDPCIFEVGPARIGVSREVAAGILVTPATTDYDHPCCSPPTTP